MPESKAEKWKTTEKPLPSPATRRFGELFAWHLSNGTRHSGTPDAPGELWTIARFANAVGVGERTVRNWPKGQNLPNDLASIERELFGKPPAYAAWRRELREAFHAAKLERDAGKVQPARWRTKTKQDSITSAWANAQALNADIKTDATYYTTFPNGKLGRGWQWIDPLEDCRLLRLRPNGIAIYLPGPNHDLWPGTNFNAPRLVRRLRTSFILTAQVRGEPRASVQGVGILLWQDESNFCRLNYVFHDLRDPVCTRFVILEGRFNGHYAIRGFLPCVRSVVYLRMKLINNIIEGAFSYDFMTLVGGPMLVK